MANPNGHLETLKPFEKTHTGDQVLAAKPLAVKLPQRIDSVIRSLPNKAEWLRRVITEAAERELTETTK